MGTAYFGQSAGVSVSVDWSLCKAASVLEQEGGLGAAILLVNQLIFKKSIDKLLESFRML